MSWREEEDSSWFDGMQVDRPKTILKRQMITHCYMRVFSQYCTVLSLHISIVAKKKRITRKLLIQQRVASLKFTIIKVVNVLCDCMGVDFLFHVAQKSAWG